MPAPKSESSPHDSEPKMRTLDEDGEALHSKTSPASHRNSLKRGSPHENTAPPWTKKKLSSVEGDNKPDSKQSSPTNDSSHTISDPPVKKAKLLKATSASCGEAPSQKAYSKAPLKRTASTESEDELSSDDSKTDLFKDRGDGDKARCIRKYSNRVKAKRKAEELPSVPQERSQGSPSAPSDTIQMDHNYGRFSELLGLGDADLDIKKENALSVTKGERQELLAHSTQLESTITLFSTTVSTKTCMEFKCAADDSKLEELKNVESQKSMDNTALASCREATEVDHITAEAGKNEKIDQAESMESRKCAANETQVSFEETQYSSSREAIKGTAHSDGRTDFACASQTDVSRETETKETTEEIKLDVTCRSTEGEHEGLETFEEAAIPAIHTDTGIEALQNEANSAQDKIQVVESDPESQTEENLATTEESVGNTETQSFEEESKSEHLQADLSPEVFGTNTNLCHGGHNIVSKPEEKLEENETNGTEFQLNQTVALCASSAEVELSEVVDRMTENCAEIMTEDCTTVSEQNQREVLSCCDTESEHKIDMNIQTKISEPTSYSALREEIQHEQNHKINEGALEAEVKENTDFELGTGPSIQIKMDAETSETFEEGISNPAVTVETSDSGCATDVTTDFNEDHVVNSNTMKSQDDIHLEHTIVHEMETSVTKISCQAPTVEVQTHSREGIRPDLITDISAEDVISENSKVVQNEGTVDFQCTDGLESECAMTPDSFHMASTVKVSQESPEASEHITSTSDEVQNHPVSICHSTNNVESVETDMQKTVTSEDISGITSTVQTQVQGSHDVTEFGTASSEKDHECVMIPTTEDNGSKNMSRTECDSSVENYRNLEMTAASMETSDATEKVEVQIQTNQEVSEVPTDDKGQKDFNITNCVGEDNTDNGFVEGMDATENQIETNVETTPEEICNLPSTVQLQSQERLEVNNINSEVQGVPQTVSCEEKEVKDRLVAECVDYPEAQICMETASAPEVTSDAPPAAEVQIEGSTEVSGLNTDLASESSAVKPDEDKVGVESVDVPETPINLEAAETGEISSAVEVENQGSSEISEVNTQTQKGPASESGENKMEEDKPTAECVHVPEAHISMDTTTAPEEIPNVSSAVELHIQGSLEITEVNAEVKEDLVTVSCKSKVDEDKSTTDCLDFSEAQRSTENVATPDVIPDPPSAVEAQIHGSPEISTPNTEVQKDPVSDSYKGESEEDKITGEFVNVSETQTDVECTAAPEICNAAPTVEKQSQRMEEVNEFQMALFDEFPKFLPVATAQNKDDENMEPVSSATNIQRDVDPISRSIENKDSGLEEETVMQVINEDKDETAVVSSQEPDVRVSCTDGIKENEELVFACGNTDEAAFTIPPSTEQIKMVNQSEVGNDENQVVYEPISSPESNVDGEIPTTSESHDGVSFLEIQNTVMQKMEEDSSAFEENRDVCTHTEKEENVENQIHVAASQDVEMEAPTVAPHGSCVTTHFEQNDMIVDEKQVAVISSSHDTSVPDGQCEAEVGKSESNGFPNFAKATESAEQDMTGPQEVTGGTVTTTTSTILETADSTSEEFVILEPVPQSEIDFDIVTQAAAESGLSVSFAEHVYHGSAFEGKAENKEILNGSQLTVFQGTEVQQCQTINEVKNAALADSNVALDQEPKHDVSSEEGVEVIQNSEHCKEPSAVTMDVCTTKTDMTNSHSQVTSENCHAVAIENAEVNLDLQEVQILEDIEIGREIVVAEADNEEDGDISIIEKPQETTKAEKSQPNEKNKDATCGINKAVEKNEDGKKPEEEKPKKQEMNTQARTKARLAALAEQKAAASKRSANKQQLNLLALCQEIAEDIATDSMLLKRIEEEKAAAAAATAAAEAEAEAASKSEASTEESPPANTEDSDTANIATPAEPEGSSASVTPTEEVSATQPASAVSGESKTAGDPPKRRFFITQVSVPLKVHEKKKLTRYQRLRQVELQREKMSWARVKKLKSDQANQMLSDIDWQAPLNAFSQFSMGPVTAAPPPSVSTSKTPPQSPTPASTPARPSTEVPNVDTKAEPTKVETPKVETTKSDPVKTVVTKNEPPSTETRKSPRQSKNQTPKETPSPGPATKVTRSAAKRALPAVPPPMPNGVSAQKQKPVEYTPYKPRPRYTFDDFELDDDPIPVAPAKPSPQSRPTQQTRPNTQANPTAQSRPTAQPKPTVLSQLSKQTPPAGQVSGQSKPANATTPQSNTATTAQVKSSVSKTPQSKAVSTVGQSTHSASPLLKSTGSGGTAQLKQLTPTAPEPACSSSSPTPVGSALQKNTNLPSSDANNCKVTSKIMLLSVT